MTGCVVWIEHHQGQITQASRAACAAAQQLDLPITAWVIGPSSVAEQVARWPNVSAVRHGHEAEVLWSIEHKAQWCIAQCGALSHVVAASSSEVNGLWPRVAACVSAPMVTDVKQILDQHTFQRLMYAGQVKVNVQVDAPCVFLSVRASAWAPLDSAEVLPEAVPLQTTADCQAEREGTSMKWLRDTTEALSLADAPYVIGGGRGVGGAEDFQQLKAFAQHMGAAVGATRAIVDAGVVDNDLQIGQTGQKIAPDIYLAVGISGAMQHCAGIQDARVIVAINTDSEADMMKAADFVWVADWREALSALQTAWVAYNTSQD